MLLSGERGEQHVRRLIREESWTELVRILTPWLTWVVAPLLPSADDVDDCVQRTLITLWESHHTVRDSLLGWLRVTVRNEAKDVLKSPRYRHLSTHGDEWDRITTAPALDYEMPGATQSALLHVLSTLSADIRETFHLRTDSGLSYQQIARVQDITVGAAKMRVLRARLVLRRAYKHVS